MGQTAKRGERRCPPYTWRLQDIGNRAYTPPCALLILLQLGGRHNRSASRVLIREAMNPLVSGMAKRARWRIGTEYIADIEAQEHSQQLDFFLA